MCKCILCSDNPKFYIEPSGDCIHYDDWKFWKMDNGICCCQRHVCHINRWRKKCTCFFCDLKLYIKVRKMNPPPPPGGYCYNPHLCYHTSCELNK